MMNHVHFHNSTYQRYWISHATIHFSTGNDFLNSFIPHEHKRNSSGCLACHARKTCTADIISDKNLYYT